MGSHKDTLLLPQTTFPIKADLPVKESARFASWGNVSAIHTDVPALATFVVDGDTYRIVKSLKNKCERCWKRCADHDLCTRCKNVVN
jgi:hypothetical protein